MEARHPHWISRMFLNVSTGFAPNLAGFYLFGLPSYRSSNDVRKREPMQPHGRRLVSFVGLPRQPFGLSAQPRPRPIPARSSTASVLCYDARSGGRGHRHRKHGCGRRCGTRSGVRGRTDDSGLGLRIPRRSLTSRSRAVSRPFGNCRQARQMPILMEISKE